MFRFHSWNPVRPIPDGRAILTLLIVLNIIHNTITRLVLPLSLIPILSRYHLRIFLRTDQHTELDLIHVLPLKNSTISPG